MFPEEAKSGGGGGVWFIREKQLPIAFEISTLNRIRLNLKKLRKSWYFINDFQLSRKTQIVNDSFKSKTNLKL